MSAIGDYIYYSYFSYEKGYKSKNAPDRNFTKAFNAYKVFNEKITDIRKTFQNLGNRKMAKSYQKLLNMYSGGKAKKSKKQKIEQYLANNLQQQLGHQIPYVDLTKMNVDAPISALNAKYAETLTNFKYKASDRVTFVNNLNELLRVAKSNKPLIESVMTGKNPVESLENRIKMLDNLIKKLDVKKTNFLDGYTGLKNTAEYKALKRLDELFKDGGSISGFHTKETKSSGILQEVRHLLNTIVLPPSAEIGAVTEYVAFDIAMCASKIGGKTIIKNLSEGVIGGEKTQTAFKADSIADIDSFLNQNKQYKFLNIDGTGYIVTNTPLKEKIDVSILVGDAGEQEELNVSIKNTSTPVIHFIKDGSLWNMIANENYNDFINHYINVVAPKVNKKMNFQAFGSEKEKYGANHVMTYDFEKAVKENGGRYELAEKAMNQLVIAKALAGYNITKVSNGKTNLMKMPNYLAVFDSYQGTNEWLVTAMKDMYKYFMNSEKSIVISQNKATGTKQNTTNPFPDSAQTLMGPSYMGENGWEWSQDESVIQARIAKTLSFLHQRKIDVYMKTASLR